MLFNAAHYVTWLFTILDGSFINWPKLKVETMRLVSVDDSIGPLHNIFVTEEGIATHFARILV